MPKELWGKLYKIRMRSKFGNSITMDEHKFCVHCWENYPEDYAEMSRLIDEQAMKALNPLWR